MKFEIIHSGPRGGHLGLIFWVYLAFYLCFSRKTCKGRGGEPQPRPRIVLSRDLPGRFTKKCYYPRLAPWWGLTGEVVRFPTGFRWLPLAHVHLEVFLAHCVIVQSQIQKGTDFNSKA